MQQIRVKWLVCVSQQETHCFRQQKLSQFYFLSFLFPKVITNSVAVRIPFEQNIILMCNYELIICISITVLYHVESTLIIGYIRNDFQKSLILRVQCTFQGLYSNQRPSKTDKSLCKKSLPLLYLLLFSGHKSKYQSSRVKSCLNKRVGFNLRAGRSIMGLVNLYQKKNEMK